MNVPKAVIFTHFGKLQFEPKLRNPVKNKKAKEKYMKILSQYLQCNKHEEIVSIVYVYIDYGIKKAPFDAWKRRAKVTLHGDIMFEETVLLDILKEAEKDAREKLEVSVNAPPQFFYIGTNELIALFNELVDIDPRLIDYLAYYDKKEKKYKFTYDSPKFVEAIIRLARGSTAHLAWDPIIRMDEDVEPQPRAFKSLFKTYSVLVKDSPFFFFSGTYGSEDGGYDPINDHAVRVTWLSDPDPANPGFYIPNAKVIQHFIADLNELGATQLVDSEEFYSENMRTMLRNSKRQKSQPKRESPQVVSGAGLIMSFRAIDLLPPFLNIGDFIVWVDDHLKRRLHEALTDLRVDDIECEANIKFKQDRHPEGIKPKDIDWAKDVYFDRLLRGCIFRRLITDLDGSPTEYASFITDIVRYRVTSLKVWETRPRKKMSEKMMKQANERYDEVLTSWTSHEFQPYASYEWAKMKKNDPDHKTNICNNVVENALRYIDLVVAWPIFIRAIRRLPFVGHRWLFRKTRDLDVSSA